ncbi:OLC1v1004381C1 [Oldenlandia corymbosa var. corymbosa]|uniref:OLC1v1004381C1 n=1 Tax=Oldenlandia corymbosa var. corymbosa TaxID=529605 RepID=A0AAV1DC62_OLDCO|nr:OLC1v1004381C1 [Oldenlandia corymbosa var. corymbosa]
MPYGSVFASIESQLQWLKDTKYSYSHSNHISPSVFQIPDKLKETKPQSYIPQFVGLGPYHHFRPEVQLMKTKKLDAIREILGIQDVDEFWDKVARFNDANNDLEPKCRSCYDQLFELDTMVLAWVLIVDAAFLIYFIRTCLKRDKSVWDQIYVDMEEDLVPDVFMLENQIPFILVNLVLKTLEISGTESCADDFNRFCLENSPIYVRSLQDIPKLRDPKTVFEGSRHMIDYMYKMILQDRPVPLTLLADLKKIFLDCIISIFQIILTGGLITLLPFFQRNTERFWFVVSEFKSAFFAGQTKPKPEEIVLTRRRKLILKNSFSVEEIPSVSRLCGILSMRVMPLPEGRGITHMGLSEEKSELRLPRIVMRSSSSETILRNLVAYELALPKGAGGSTPLRDFVNLMCGLVKSKKDVELLRSNGIIEKEISTMSDDEILEVWNGLKNSVSGCGGVQIISDVKEVFEGARFVRWTRWVVGGVVKFLNYFSFLTWFVRWITDLISLFKPVILLLGAALIGYGSACGIHGCDRNPAGGGDAALHMAGFMLPRKFLPQ